MLVKNAYPEKPEVDYEHTSISPGEVVEFIKTLDATAAVKIAAYVLFNNESGAGKSGINNNYIGLQADGSRLGAPWNDAVTGTCLVKENSTGNIRRFVAFADFKPCISYLVQKVQKRGLFIGGYANPYAKLRIFSEKDFARAYYKEWVMGDSVFEPSDIQILDIINQYSKAKTYFN